MGKMINIPKRNKNKNTINKKISNRKNSPPSQMDWANGSASREFAAFNLLIKKWLFY